MSCLNPIHLKNPNLGKNPSLHLNTKSLYITVPCGKCPSCITARRREIVTRYLLESLNNGSNYFFTLTYDEIYLPRIGDTEPGISSKYPSFSSVPCVSKTHAQLFLQRLRNSFRSIEGFTPLRYALVSEYGPHELRPHYHGILFGVPSEWNAEVNIQRYWPHGFTQVGPLSDGGCGYVAKYLLKDSKTPVLPDGSRLSNFQLHSRFPPLGCGGLTPEVIRYINKTGSRRIKIKQLGDLVIPYSCLKPFLTERQLRRLRAIEHKKAQEYKDTKIENLSKELFSITEVDRVLMREIQETWITLSQNIKRSKSQSKDI